MSQVSLTDDQWRKIRDFLREDPNVYIDKAEANCRLFVEAKVYEWMNGKPLPKISSCIVQAFCDYFGVNEWDIDELICEAL
jgi:hypothetical protein